MNMETNSLSLESHHGHVKYMLNLIVFILILHEEETEQVKKQLSEITCSGSFSHISELGFLFPQTAEPHVPLLP